MQNHVQSEAFSLLAAGDVDAGLKKLSEDRNWNCIENALPIFLGIPGAKGFGESLLLASIVKQVRAQAEKRVKIFASQEAASILYSDNKFALIETVDETCVASGKARLPLVELNEFFAANQPDLQYGTTTQPGRCTRVGIAWRSAPKKPSAKPVSDEKLIPIDKFIDIFRPAFERMPIELVSFQRHLTSDEYRGLEKSGFKFSVVEQSFHEDSNQSPLAEKIRGIDLMVTVSTTTAHISGYLGVRTLVIAKDRGAHQWFWPTQKKTGIRFYPSTDVALAPENAKAKCWWKECIDEARQCILQHFS